MRVGGWQLRSFMDLTCTSWGDAKDGFEERTVTFAKSECLTYDSDKETSELCFERHCPSWDNLTESHPWKLESAAVFLLVCFWSGCTCWANFWNPCVRNAGWPTARNPPGPWDKPLDTHSWKTKAGCRAELDRVITKNGKSFEVTIGPRFDPVLMLKLWSFWLILPEYLPLLQVR